jgi:ornithine carbamoyltransferase
MLASTPASMVNQKHTDLGIPNRFSLTPSRFNEVNEQQMLEYQISTSVLEKCHPDVIFLPCPPVSRGKEVTADAMRHPACQSAAAKAYLLHAQNALLEWVVT